MRPALAVVVARGDGDTVGEVLRTIEREANITAEGRAFLNGRGVGLDEPVEPGDTLELYAPRGPERAGAIAILAQRDGIVMLDKPAGLPCETTRQGEDSVVSELMKRMRSGRVHAATRLDVQVSGVVLCTLGSDAARRVQTWRDAGQIERTYLAIAPRAAHLGASGTWDAPLARGNDRAGRHRALPFARDAKPARTRFRVHAATPLAVLVELSPDTGRMHQLRAHAAYERIPLFGDRLYGGATSVPCADGRVIPIARVALHCAEVALPSLAATSSVPEDFRVLWRALGGDDEAFSSS